MTGEELEAQARHITLEQLHARRAMHARRAHLTPEERAAEDLAAEAKARGITPAQVLARRARRISPAS